MPPKAAAIPKFYTVEEAVPLMRRKRSTLYRLISENKVHYSRDPGGTLGFTEEDIAKNWAAGKRSKVA